MKILIFLTMILNSIQAFPIHGYEKPELAGLIHGLRQVLKIEGSYDPEFWKNYEKDLNTSSHFSASVMKDFPRFSPLEFFQIEIDDSEILFDKPKFLDEIFNVLKTTFVEKFEGDSQIDYEKMVSFLLHSRTQGCDSLILTELFLRANDFLVRSNDGANCHASVSESDASDPQKKEFSLGSTKSEKKVNRHHLIQINDDGVKLSTLMFYDVGLDSGEGMAYLFQLMVTREVIISFEDLANFKAVKLNEVYTVVPSEPTWYETFLHWKWQAKEMIQYLRSTTRSDDAFQLSEIKN